MKRANNSGGKSQSGGANKKQSKNSPFSSDNEDPNKQDHSNNNPKTLDHPTNNQPNEENKAQTATTGLSSRSFLGKRKATHMPIKEDKARKPQPPVQPPKALVTTPVQELPA